MIAEAKADLSTVSQSARRKITRRIVPYLFLLFIIAYLDRVNAGYAALQMKGDLGFTDAVMGFGAGIFFIGYFLFEILAASWWKNGARAVDFSHHDLLGNRGDLMGFVHTKNQFYVLRFLLGTAEAGFFPGIIVYFSHWFRYEDRAKTVGMFMAAVPLSNIVGSPISGLLLRADWWGIAGWRWLFIIEGAPAIIFGVITIFYLTDRPHQARWLTPDEREWISAELKKEDEEKRRVRSFRILEAFRNPDVIKLTLGYFFMITAIYGFNFWLPTIIKRLSGFSNLVVTFVAALPYCVGLISVLVMGWSSDKTRERRWHTALPMMVGSLGLLLSVLMGNHIALAVSMFSLAAAGMYGYLPGFWSLPTSFLTGTAAAASIGLINSIGNLGGFAGPYIVGYLSQRTNSFMAGVLYLSSSALLAAMIILSLRTAGRRNKLLT